MKDVVTRLQLAYRRELELYGEVLDLAHEGLRRVRACRPLDELHGVNERKRALLEEIERVERTIAHDKQVWRASSRDADGARELQLLLGTITERIEGILRAERETDRAIVAGSGLESSIPARGF